MDGEGLPGFPGALNNRRFANVADLFDDIQLTQFSCAGIIRCKRCELRGETIAAITAPLAT